MKRRSVWLQMLPGIIPLFIYVIADEIWGTKIGLIVAVVVGLAEMIFYLVKDKKIDKFILFDTLLLIALGGISMLLDNDIFFKLKPALIGFIGVVLIGIMAFFKPQLIIPMMHRYMKDFQAGEEQLKLMQKQMKVIFYIFTAYTLLVLYSALFMSKEAWAFISGGLFYIIFGIYFVFEIIKNKMKRRR